MRASQNQLPQSFEASHRPQLPQYFLVVMSGRRNSYVELDSAKKLKILALQCTRCASLTNNVVNLESLCAINTGETFKLSFSPSAFVRRVWILKILNLSLTGNKDFPCLTEKKRWCEETRTKNASWIEVGIFLLNKHRIILIVCRTFIRLRSLISLVKSMYWLHTYYFAASILCFRRYFGPYHINLLF